MARGWESKSVEEQQAEAREAREARSRRDDAGAAASTHAAERAELQLRRARVLQDLQTACDRRYRALLERTLEHLDDELRALH